ncbi:uncharacterized protein LOC108675533 isoform X1 [Hyalella azteca]|uniref:Uncharacterized protein LOC108675533 isoform X1 n=1 Tax=Hyalella azteca TaxID=294128 RepID=A0A8B7NZ71_HYAAZ|nr:uncharacterized protein LOC108675533 isoform X2 [Hyalella azteca]XP_018019042.1 uncharacterized protein LOC108675533 isoform X1 [Hyalella azteca]
MLWTISGSKLKDERQPADGRQSSVRGSVPKKLVIPAAAGALLLCVGAYYFATRTPGADTHVARDFEKILTEVCRAPKIPIPDYTGVETFFEFLMNPDVNFCYSWIEFGGEKLPLASQSEEECNDEVRKAKFMCFNDEFEMNLDPCLVYSFAKDLDSQFERDMHLFSCETHVFDTQIEEGEHVQRSEFWYEHRWDISEFPYDLPPGEKLNPAKNEDNSNLPTLRRSMDFITTMLNHKGREIKFVKSDLLGREWILLKQIITYHDFADFRQIGLRVHLPPKTRSMSTKERHDTYLQLYQTFQGLSCLGYRYVMSRPIKYYKGGVRVPEMNRTFYPAYEINFAKDLNFVKDTKASTTVN